MIILKKKKKALLYFKDYIERKVTNEEFLNEYKNDKYYEKIISKIAIKKHWGYIDDDDIERFVNNIRWLYLCFQDSVIRTLTYYKIDFVIKQKEYLVFEKWSNILPSCFYGELEIYMLLEEIDIKEKHTKKWYIDYIKSIYRFEKYLPRWLQNFEWPKNDDGSPCIFLYQTGYPNSHDYIEYYFKNNKSEVVKIEQYI